MSRIVECVRDLEVYKAVFELEQKVFEVSKTWPAGEQYALTVGVGFV
jgi:hypothetical protein